MHFHTCVKKVYVGEWRKPQPSIQKKIKRLFCSKALNTVACIALILNVTFASVPVMASTPSKSLSFKLASQQEVVRGKVTSIGNEPLAGVSVVEKNTQNGTTTNEDGEFSISVSGSSSILVFSYIGAESQEVTVGTQTYITVTLDLSDGILDEIVVTGYSSQRRGNITASVVTVDANELKKTVASPSVGNMLQGKVAGADIIAGTGRPGENPTIRIRGRSTISSETGILWVVDGVIAHGTPNINPNDVESISVLKDGAATTQYGSRGVNGVIVVTTKRAKEVGPGTITANLRTGTSSYNQGNFRLMNGQQLYDLFQEFSNQSALPTNISPELQQADYDWLDNGTQAGRLNDFSLTYTGKTDRASIYAGGNYYKEEGSVKGYEYERLSARLNIDYDVTNKVTFKPKINVTYTSDESREHSLYQMYLNLPWDNPYNTDGSIKNPQAGGITWYGRDNSNYLYDLQYNYGESDIFDVQSNLDFEYRISDRFTFVSTNNAAYYHSAGLSYVDPQSNSGLGDAGRVSNSTAKRIVRFTNQMLRYNTSIDKHRVSAFTAYEYNDYVYQGFGATGKGIVPGSTILDATSEPQGINGTKNDYAYQSVMAQGEYNYDDRYSFQASFRRDGSSRFGRDTQYGNFWAVSGAWNVHNERFFDVDAFNYLRLKASHGLVGNVPTALYASYSLYTLDAQYAGVPAGQMGQLGNNLVTWESTKASNIALEFGLYNRLNVTFEAYDKNTNDLLHRVVLPGTAGWAGYWANIGAVRNQGVELSIGADILPSASPFQWNLNFNIARNVNEVKELYNNQDIPNDNQRISEGRDINSWYIRKWVGVDPENGNPQWERIDPTTGEVSIVNVFNQASLQFIDETSTPDFYGGFTSSMEYKNVYLNANFAFSKGAYAYHSARQLFDADGAYPYYNQIVLRDGWSRWTPTNTDATHPLPVYNSQNASNGISSRYIEDASFIRLRNVTLGYRLPSTVSDKLGVKGIDVFLSGDNLWISTKFSGIDPEAALFGDATSQYPAPKRVLFGLNFSF